MDLDSTRLSRNHCLTIDAASHLCVFPAIIDHPNHPVTTTVGIRTRSIERKHQRLLSHMTEAVSTRARGTQATGNQPLIAGEVQSMVQVYGVNGSDLGLRQPLRPWPWCRTRFYPPWSWVRISPGALHVYPRDSKLRTSGPLW